MSKPIHDRMIGEAPAFLQVLESVSQVAPLDKPVLIVGERGTGKELIAARLHYLSERWDATYLKMNCAAISDSLLESELFGHEAGSFTGAIKARPGRFERADGGTLFMDELATTSPLVQEKILRLIEYGEFERIGGTRTLTTNVRLVAATNVDLPSLAEAGKFRSDLLDRLAFDVITLPPLRHRREDIVLLATQFAMNMVSELDREFFTGFSDHAIDVLLEHDWPGNVRELKNTVERAVYRAEVGELIDELILDPFASPYRPRPTPHSRSDASGAAARTGDQRAEEDSPIDDPNIADSTPASDTRRESSQSLPLDLKTVIKDQEIRFLKQAMEQAKHNQRKAADLLGLTYHQLRGYLKKYELIGSADD
ncbi:MAG: phage shock protein operon transcriptional activator [Pseudomonadaceae bacterium]|nr:phage shock protein operon transcriptional activator [Pseudomonadaceae bacterium]